MHSNIGLGIEGGFGRGRGLRAASLLFVAATLVHLAADLLILVGSSARASMITRTLPEDETHAFRSAGSVGMFLFGMLFLATWAAVR
ncbi:MAG: hypothetical protein Q8R28_06080 [Dehalococcoidia bacterium]|nr:hypothetical protein [Dehalococcoidia bacterium]